jgi:hypothetical protein
MAYDIVQDGGSVSHTVAPSSDVAGPCVQLLAFKVP